MCGHHVAEVRAYQFHGNLEANAAALAREAQAVRCSLEKPDRTFSVEEVVSLHNRAALDQHRAGRWERAYTISTGLLDLLVTLQDRVPDKASDEDYASCALNVARLWAARGDHRRARLYFDSLIHLPNTRVDIVLPEIAKCYETANAVAEGLEYLEKIASVLVHAHDPHLLRARAMLLVAAGEYALAASMHARMDATALPPIVRCLFAVEQAQVAQALRDPRCGDYLLAAEKLADKLLAVSPSTAPGPLLVALAVSNCEAGMDHAGAADQRIRAVHARAAQCGFEAIQLRSWAALISLSEATGRCLSDDAIATLLTLAGRTRYSPEVFYLWLGLGRCLADSGTRQQRDTLAIPLLRRVAQSGATVESVSATKLAAQAKLLLREYEYRGESEPWSFFDDEATVIGETFATVIDLTSRLYEAIV